MLGAAGGAAGGAGGAGVWATGVSMGGAGGWGVSTPVGALGSGVGSAIAMGRGAGGGVGALVMVRFTGAGLGAGGGGSTLGTGASMISVRISTGRITSTARRSRPDCMAQSTATCSSTTPPAMAALRLMPGPEAKREEEVVIDQGRAHPDVTHDAYAETGGKGVRLYLRNIHQVEPITRIRLPPNVAMSSMLRFP